ncbi:phospholipase D family protein [Rubritalea tangerina]|uniref:Phospholipase D family protein n=1 Tax=Rubritalea tangerina TaxID=430798 RepID=A0ABW4ZCL2_9BACT
MPIKLPRHLFVKSILALMLVFMGFYLSTTCTKLPNDFPKTRSLAFPQPEQTKVGGIFARKSEENNHLSGFAVIPTSREAFTNRVGLAEFAEKTIDVQYYIWNNDTVGNLLAERLIRAAERGVRVRFLVDDLNFQHRDSLAAGLSAHPNIEVRIFNPAMHRSIRALEMAASFSRLNKRMHNKIMIMDNACAIIGGRNIADDYFGLHPKANKRDLDIAAAGPIVKEISNTFDEFWNSIGAVPIEALAPPTDAKAQLADSIAKVRHKLSSSNYPYPLDSDIATLRSNIEKISNSMVWAHGEVLYDNINSMLHADNAVTVNSRLLEVVNATEKELLIESAYFILRDKGLKVAQALRAIGVNIRVLTNSLASNDVVAAQSGYAHKADNLLKAGVTIYELRPDAACVNADTSPLGKHASTSLHTKTLVIDRTFAFVGSYNLDPRSADINSEIGILVESPAFAQAIATFLDQGVQPENAYKLSLDRWNRILWKTTVDGQEKTWTHSPNTNFWQRLQAETLGLLPIEDQL